MTPSQREALDRAWAGRKKFLDKAEDCKVRAGRCYGEAETLKKEGNEYFDRAAKLREQAEQAWNCAVKDMLGPTWQRTENGVSILTTEDGQEIGRWY